MRGEGRPIRGRSKMGRGDGGGRIDMVLRWILRVCGALCLIYYVGCGMAIRFDTAQLWLWLVLGAGCFALDGILGFGRHMGWRLPTGVQAAIWVIFGIGAAAALGMMGLVASHMNDQAPAGADYMLVLGARVNGTDSGNAEASGALLHRCESAAVYAAENPETVFIATGGKGADEPITEAECIKREMVRLGVPEERILLEEQSQSTAENMKYSRAMMEKEGASVAVVTNNFHVYRAGRLAEAAFEGPVYRQSAEFTWILLPHYIVREAVCSVLDALNGYMRLW